MKYRIVILCSSLISACALYSQTETAQENFACHNRTESATQASKFSSDDLTHLRNQVAQQTIQIKGILDTLCDAVKSSTLAEKELVCRELSLLCDFVQNMVTELPALSYQNLRNLIKINNELLGQLHEQLESGDLCGLCHIDTSLFTILENPKRDALSIDEIAADVSEINADITEINAELSYVQEKINSLWNLISSISLAPYTETALATSNNAWDFINRNKGYGTAAAVLAGTALMFHNDNPIDLIAGLVERIPVYALVALYVLRQKKNNDVAEYAHSWFGNDSYCANSMITLKKWVGQPKPAVHIIARRDMSLEEQQLWAEENNCTVVGFQNALCTLPLAVLLSYQIQKDTVLISERMSSFVKSVLNCL